MINKFCTILLLILFLLLPGISWTGYVPGEFIIKFKVLPQEPKMVDNKVVTGIKIIDELNLKYNAYDIETIFPDEIALKDIFLIKVSTGTDILSLVNIYSHIPEIEYVQPNYTYALRTIIPNDTEFNSQWALNNTGQAPFLGTRDADIDAPEAWEITTGASEIIVAVVDTGVEYTHSDLKDNIWINSKEIPNNGIDDDGNGYTDDIYGWDFSDNNNDPMDTHGHGTHVAGIAAAVGNNSLGVAGVSWKSKIMCLKIFPNATDVTASKAIKYATDNGARVINNSWGNTRPGPPSPVLEDTIDYAIDRNVVVVFAAGNDNTDDPTWAYPASYEPVIGVGATDHNDNRASYSNYGSWLDISAPGGSPTAKIYSTWRSNGYNYSYGTSMACAFVSGVVCLLLSKNNQLDVQNVKKVLYSRCDDLGSQGVDQYYGYGRVNAYSSLTVTIIPETVSIAYPNPLKKGTEIRFAVPATYRDTSYTLKIYNFAGELIKTSARLSWDGTNDEGKYVSSGLYFYIIETGKGNCSGKFTVLK